MKFLLIFTLILSSALAGRENFPYGIYVEWHFVGEEAVVFTLNVPDIVYTTWAWAGFGLKDAHESDLSMGHSDLFTMYFDGSVLDDRHGVGDLLPPIDYKKGGTNDLNLLSEINEDGFHKFSWQRALITGDILDIALRKNEEYIMMWAVGQSYDGGPISHTPWNRGREYITLSEDYIDDSSDDYKGDGDGSYVQPENTLVSAN